MRSEGPLQKTRLLLQVLLLLCFLFYLVRFPPAALSRLPKLYSRRPLHLNRRLYCRRRRNHLPLHDTTQGVVPPTLQDPSGAAPRAPRDLSGVHSDRPSVHAERQMRMAFWKTHKGWCSHFLADTRCGMCILTTAGLTSVRASSVGDLIAAS